METIKLYELEINHSNYYNYNIVYEQLEHFVNNSISRGTHLLDYENINSKDDCNFIEKFVYDNAIYHLDEYNKYNNTYEK